MPARRDTIVREVESYPNRVRPSCHRLRAAIAQQSPETENGAPTQSSLRAFPGKEKPTTREGGIMKKAVLFVALASVLLPVPAEPAGAARP
jgi:hypothetical protein